MKPMKDHTIPAWPDLISTCLASTEFMTLATTGPHGLWANPVYFAYDQKRTLYFISQLDCVHMRNLMAAPDVAGTIYPTNQSGDVFGTYFKGQAHVLTDHHDKKIADDVYYGRIYPNDPDGKARDQDGYRINPTWHFVRITVTQFWYFDTRYFDETRTLVPMDTWG
jgi:uncharacterized protein YhbP (UPF0306 family)